MNSKENNINDDIKKSPTGHGLDKIANVMDTLLVEMKNDMTKGKVEKVNNDKRNQGENLISHKEEELFNPKVKVLSTTSDEEINLDNITLPDIESEFPQRIFIEQIADTECSSLPSLPTVKPELSTECVLLPDLVLDKQPFKIEKIIVNEDGKKFNVELELKKKEKSKDVSNLKQNSIQISKENYTHNKIETSNIMTQKKTNNNNKNNANQNNIKPNNNEINKSNEVKIKDENINKPKNNDMKQNNSNQLNAKKEPSASTIKPRTPTAKSPSRGSKTVSNNNIQKNDPKLTGTGQNQNQKPVENKNTEPQKNVKPTNNIVNTNNKVAPNPESQKNLKPANIVANTNNKVVASSNPTTQKLFKPFSVSVNPNKVTPNPETQKTIKPANIVVNANNKAIASSNLATQKLIQLMSNVSVDPNNKAAPNLETQKSTKPANIVANTNNKGVAPSHLASQKCIKPSSVSVNPSNKGVAPNTETPKNIKPASNAVNLNNKNVPPSRPETQKNIKPTSNATISNNKNVAPNIEAQKVNKPISNLTNPNNKGVTPSIPETPKSTKQPNLSNNKAAALSMPGIFPKTDQNNNINKNNSNNSTKPQTAKSNVNMNKTNNNKPVIKPDAAKTAAKSNVSANIKKPVVKPQTTHNRQLQRHKPQEPNFKTGTSNCSSLRKKICIQPVIKTSPTPSYRHNSNTSSKHTSNTSNKYRNRIPLRTVLPLRLPYVNRSNPMADFLNLVNKAKNDRKTFTVCGNYYTIRKSLAERGWLEKVRFLVTDNREPWKQLEHLSNYELFEGMKNKEEGEKYRKALISKLLARHQVDFYWDYVSNPFNVNNDKVKHTLINRYPAGSTRVYGSKAGLCEALQEAHWNCIDGLAHIRFPRTYNLAYEYDKQSFIEDFQITAAAALLKWIIKTVDDPVMQLMSRTGKIPVAVFNFAILQCQNFIKSKQHKDIDGSCNLAKVNDWEVFLDKFYKLIHNVNHFKESNKITKLQLVDQSKQILKKMEKYWPHLKMDGYMNLWLLKPHNGSQGHGILVCRTLKYILETIKNAKNRKYVVQKYIERPLLIYNTKFDIRQWFLLTHQPYLQLWMYKDCYLRFSSQTYCLHKLHESIHLTNNSIQCRYKNNCDRNTALPLHNMWHCETFKQYLYNIGYPNAWNNIIYKGMKEAIVSLILCCQDKVIARVNSFELCGADFMLTEDFHPYLIEINTRPALYNSTPVTGKLCPRVLEDLIKVTVDHARNPKASTGKFELIYKERHVGKVKEDKASLLAINGQNYFSKYRKNTKKTGTDKRSLQSTSFENGVIKNILNINPDQVKKDVKSTLEKILAIIHVEREKRIVDNKQRDYQSETFKNMLSEFVNIISGVDGPNGNKTD